MLRTKDAIFNGSLISGRDNFSLNADTPIEEIHLLLAEAFRQYNSKAYKQDFAFIDDIKLIRDSEQVSQLNDELAFKLDNELNLENCWLTTPRIIKWDFISGFAFSSGKLAAMHSDLKLDTLLENIRQRQNAVTVASLKKQSV